MLMHPLSSPPPLKLAFPHDSSVSTHFHVLGLQMTRTVLLRKKKKKDILSADLILQTHLTAFMKILSVPL